MPILCCRDGVQRERPILRCRDGVQIERREAETPFGSSQDHRTEN